MYIKNECKGWDACMNMYSRLKPIPVVIGEQSHQVLEQETLREDEQLTSRVHLDTTTGFWLPKKHKRTTLYINRIKHNYSTVI